METDKKLETLEEELKLLKGELKQSLASVRDYLLNMELPSSEFATVLAALGDGDSNRISMSGNLGNGNKEEPPSDMLEEESEEEAFGSDSKEAQEDELTDQNENLEDEDIEDTEGTEEGEEMENGGDAGDAAGTMDSLEGEDVEEPEDELPYDEEENDESAELDESLEPESESPSEEGPLMEKVNINSEVGQYTPPRVNLLANLITWVARAEKEIGHDQLPTFLEVYGISGHLSSELREVIIHLSDITVENPEEASRAEAWSQSLLSLHGILTGGDAPLHTLRPLWSNAVSEPQPEPAKPEKPVEKAKEMPVKLKLVFPNGNGEGKEFCIDLRPAADNNGH